MPPDLKVQVALFIDEKNAKNAEKHIDAMEDAIRSGGFSNKVLGLYIPVDDAKVRTYLSNDAGNLAVQSQSAVAILFCTTKAG